MCDEQKCAVELKQNNFCFMAFDGAQNKKHILFPWLQLSDSSVQAYGKGGNSVKKKTLVSTVFFSQFLMHW